MPTVRLHLRAILNEGRPFGQNQAGELYVLDHTGGVVYRLRSQGSS